MLEFFLDISGFFLKTVIVILVIVIAFVFAALTIRSVAKEKDDNKDDMKLCVENLKDKFKKRKKFMTKAIERHDPDKGLKSDKEKKLSAKKKEQQKKDKKKQDREDYLKDLKSKEEAGLFCPKNLYVIDFDGSTNAHEVEELRFEIDAILDVATPSDEVIVNLTSPGGVVNGYGLCSSQLSRIRDRGINLVVTVDSVAASGGYLMACVANKIVAAPFAYIGSIGVVAGIPNFRRVMDKHDIDYEQVTAGKYKRTLTMFGENTPEGREKFKEELNVIHERFKDQIVKYRSDIDIDAIATGEHWLALDALERGLIDEISTSDEYIQKRAYETYNCVFKLTVKKKEKKTLLNKVKDLFALDTNKVLNNKILESFEDDTFSKIR